jgi:hypothetical protein
MTPKRQKLTQRSGALQEAMVAPKKRHSAPPMVQQQTNLVQNAPAMSMGGMVPEARPQASGVVARGGIYHHAFTTTVREGTRALVTDSGGRITVVDGPARILRWGSRVEAMRQHLAHPGQFLIVRHRDGRQSHVAGPTSLWFDPREHVSIECEDALQIAAEEAVVVYTEADDGAVTRRIARGPATFVPGASEWLHTFSWHGTVGGEKVPGALEFQKLWLLPDQMYHDVAEVRTADDAVITIRLMIFFHLQDIEKLLATSHDPIGDFVNATTSDVVEFVRQRTFDAFKQNSDQLNELSTYRQLVKRAEQCGYRIHNVVYRGYGAPPSLQQMHDAATESRTRLQLERATQQQAQELEDFKQERALVRAARERTEAAAAFQHQADLRRREQEEQLAAEAAQRNAARELNLLDQRARQTLAAEEDAREQAHLARLGELGVDLTALLTKGRADRVIELRGGGEATHVHVDGRS